MGDLPFTYIPKPNGLAGMLFDGWWTDASGGSQVTENTVVPVGLSEITLHAHWIGLIRYEKVNNTDRPDVTIDANGVASGFWGESGTAKICALRTIAEDKFDFSGDFSIAMKIQRGNESDSIRQDVFGGLDVAGSNNLCLDFGINGANSQWEIANCDGTHALVQNSEVQIQQNEVAWLAVYRRLNNGESTVDCYVSKNDNWQIVRTGSQGNFTMGGFAIGTDPVNTEGEYFRGSIYLNECYLLQQNPNSPQKCGKYILRDKDSFDMDPFEIAIQTESGNNLVATEDDKTIVAG